MSFIKKVSSKLSYLVISSAIVWLIYFATDKAVDDTALVDAVLNDCQAVSIIDGDSIKVICDGKRLHLRLEYIDAPELSQRPWGANARSALKSMLNKPVQVNISHRDRYGRYLAVIKNGDKNINLALVESGIATVYRRYHPPKIYLAAKAAAKLEKLGIWAVSGLQQNPQRWRRLSQ